MRATCGGDDGKCLPMRAGELLSRFPKISNEIFESFTADFTACVHHAMRSDGQWFTRMQTRGAYGYQWSAWRTSVAPESRRSTGRKARLPKAATAMACAETITYCRIPRTHRIRAGWHTLPEEICAT